MPYALYCYLFMCIALTVGCIDVEKMDIAFLIDSSKSVNSDDFNRQKEFIREILKEFPIGYEKSRVGVIQYGAGAMIKIKFNDYLTSSSLLRAVDDLPYNEAKESRLDLALQIAQDDLFTLAAGARIGDDKAKQVF